MSILAYDLGASSGRAIIGRLNGSKMEVEELHRFPNDPVQLGDRLHWDILRLFHEMKQGLLKAKNQGIRVESLGIDSWAVDFGLISDRGELLGNPYHYRDSHTDGVMEQVFQEIPSEDIFRKTGIQFLTFNTIFQLAALKRADHPVLQQAKHFLMIPDLLRYFLTGEMYSEFSNATTTQLYNPLQGDWDTELLNRLGIPREWFGKVLPSGSSAGELRTSLRDELGVERIPVVAVAEHDTGSAVAAVPATDKHFAYLSCGTWSLMGTEVDAPVMNETALKLNFTNEGGAYGTFRLLKNIMGLWLLQESKRQWEREGMSASFPELIRMAESAPAFASLIDPDDPLFMAPGDMPSRIREYCSRTGQIVPQEPGAVVRCILESLALKFKCVLEWTEQLSGHTFGGLHMVGGGIHNTLLCQWTANAIGKPVWTGPAEGSAIGNLAVQWISQGVIKDIWEARRLIRDSFGVTMVEPEHGSEWTEAYGTFRELTGLDVRMD